MTTKTKLAAAIESARLEWQSSHGKCFMCDIGDPPYNGVHRPGGSNIACGNADGCTLCAGCLPLGEVCQACYRKAVS